MKKKLFLCSYAHNRKSDRTYFDSFSLRFRVIHLLDYRANPFMVALSFVSIFWVIRLSVIRAVRFALSVEFAYNKFSFLRMIYLIQRIGFISRYQIDGDCFVFRGLNDPLVSYLRSRYGSAISIIIIPHGTDFVEPKHHHWKNADFFLTDYRKLKFQGFGPEIVPIGRLEYHDIDLELRHKRNKMVDGYVGIVCPHSDFEVLKRIDKICFEIEAQSDFKCSIRFHPGDQGKLRSVYQSSCQSLTEYMDGASILLFPVGCFGWISNVYYEALMRGLPAFALCKENDKPQNFNKNIGLPFVYFESESVIFELKQSLKSDGGSVNMDEIFVNSFGCEDRIRKFIYELS